MLMMNYKHGANVETVNYRQSVNKLRCKMMMMIMNYEEQEDS